LRLYTVRALQKAPRRVNRALTTFLSKMGGTIRCANQVTVQPFVRVEGAQSGRRTVTARVTDRFAGKQGLVLGVANKRSLAWAIAKRLTEEGAELAFTFQGERIEKNVRELAESVSSPFVTECDVRSDDDMARVFPEVGEAFGGGLDLLVHSVAFVAAEDLEDRFTDTPRERFWLALDVSTYSLVACARAAEPLMAERDGGSIMTMTYLGGVRAVPHYNVRGVAKAASTHPSAAWPGTWARRTSASMPSPPGSCGRSRRARSPAFRPWRRSSRSGRRSTGTSTPTTSAPRLPISCRTKPTTSPGRRSTSTPATTRWAL
jgi:NAD(P)-dependent dehydrogenase (short-subunit alcohol dehydrogenase family)